MAHDLGGEVLHQFNLLLSERAHLLTVDGDRPNQLVLFEHRNTEKGTGTTGVDKPNERRGAFDVGLLRPDVGNVNNLPRVGDTPERKLRARVNDRFTTPLFDMRRRSMQRDGPKPPALAKPHDAEFCLADARGILQHCLEHRLQLTRRTGDDAQHLGRRGLLLQRLAQIVCALPQLVKQAGILYGDHGLGGEVRNQFNVLFGERLRLLPIDDDIADQLALFQHRNG